MARPPGLPKVVCMGLLELVKYEITRIKTQYNCKHAYVRTKTIYGEMVNILGYKSVWHCVKCDKRIVSRHFDKY